MKVCSKCGRCLPVSEFHANKKPDRVARGWQDDGIAPWCRSCRSKSLAARREQISHYNAEYYKKNRESRIKQVHDYQRQNPEIKRVVANRRRARLHQAPGRHTTGELDAIYEMQQGYWYYCGCGPLAKDTGHFDHVIPIVRGGSNEASNLV